MNYENKLKARIIKFTIFLVIGITAFIIGLVVKFSTGLDSYSTGYLTSTGGGLICISIAIIIKNISALKNKDKQKAMRIEEQDERNLFITYKAGYYAMAITAIVLYILSFYFAFTNSAMLTTITTISGFLVFIYIITYYILRKVK